MTIKVLIIDDSAIVRNVLSKELSLDPEIEVVGIASDPIIGRDKIVQLRPDVITLDIEMPRMDGLQFLEKLMKHYPMPVIVVSSLGKAGGEVALRAIELGAVEFVTKPGSAYSVGDMADQLVDKIKAAAAVKTFKTVSFCPHSGGGTKALAVKATKKIIAIGASTGGTEALKEILVKMPVNAPAMVIVQHMPQSFTKAFATRLNGVCKIEVKEAEHGEYLSVGKALIAPGNFHMEIERSGSDYFVKLNSDPMVHHQRPAVDILFNSVAKMAGKNAVGCVLTGMGKDGAAGLLNMKNAGANTVVQDEKTCVVFGMPKEAIARGAVTVVKPLNLISETIIDFANK